MSKFHIVSWTGPLLLCDTELARLRPAVPGVYLLHAFAPEFGAYPVFYAGRTHDLQRRLGEHLNCTRANRTISRVVRSSAPTYFSATPVHGEDHRAAVEAGLILLLEPIANGQRPTAEPIFVNLPPLRLALSEDRADEAC